MSIPGPLPYERKRFGVEREAPAKRGPRPYAERIAKSRELVQKTSFGPGAARASLPTWAMMAMVVGAFAPVVYAIPEFGRTMFGSLVDATYPASAGVTMGAQALASGWVGAVAVLFAGAVGLAASRLASTPAIWNHPSFRALGLLLVLALVLACAAFVFVVASQSSVAVAPAAAWVVVTGAAGAFGARLSARRENWQGAVLCALALCAGGRFVLGSLALVFLALSDKEFPGQVVALFPWRRSQVAIEPIAPRPEVAAAPEGVREERAPLPAAGTPFPFAAGVFLLLGAFLPFAYHPALREALFEPLVRAFAPLTAFAPYTPDLLAWALGVLGAGGAAWPSALLALLFIGGTTAGAVVAAAEALGRRRRGAVLGGAVLIMLGRPLLGLAVLFCLAASWNEFGRPRRAHAGAKESGPEAAAH